MLHKTRKEEEELEAKGSFSVHVRKHYVVMIAVPMFSVPFGPGPAQTVNGLKFFIDKRVRSGPGETVNSRPDCPDPVR
jgi:hypothetical protein